MKRLNVTSNKLKILSKVFFALTLIGALQTTIALIWETSVKLPMMPGLPLILFIIGVLLSHKAESKKKEESCKDLSPFWCNYKSGEWNPQLKEKSKK